MLLKDLITAAQACPDPIVYEIIGEGEQDCLHPMAERETIQEWI